MSLRAARRSVSPSRWASRQASSRGSCDEVSFRAPHGCSAATYRALWRAQSARSAPPASLRLSRGRAGTLREVSRVIPVLVANRLQGSRTGSGPGPCRQTTPSPFLSRLRRPPVQGQLTAQARSRPGPQERERMRLQDGLILQHAHRAVGRRADQRLQASIERYRGLYRSRDALASALEPPPWKPWPAGVASPRPKTKARWCED